MIYINTDNLGSWESETLKKGIADIAAYAVEHEYSNPDITEVFIETESKEIYCSENRLKIIQAALDYAIEGEKEAAEESRDYYNETQPYSYM